MNLVERLLKEWFEATVSARATRAEVFLDHSTYTIQAAQRLAESELRLANAVAAVAQWYKAPRMLERAEDE